ncbi:ImuA family protein [Taibaiella chishuiensis]|nr:Error-prone repair protein ImuA [Taibaiella chishuiensis]
MSKSEQVQALQREILAMQGFRVRPEREQQDTGLGIINQSFPHHTFPANAVHEFISGAPEEAAATSGFMTGLLGKLDRSGRYLWVSTRRTVFPPAIRLLGLAPDQVIFVDAASNRDALWAIEEGLKCASLAAVVGEVRDLSFTESRRLQLAVEQSRVTGLIHRSGSRLPGVTACVSRWRIRPLPSQTAEGLPGVGFPRWQVELLKIRNGKPGVWQVEWTVSGFRIACLEQAAAVPVLQRTA